MARSIWQLSTRHDIQRPELLREITKLLTSTLDCDEADIHLAEASSPQVAQHLPDLRRQRMAIDRPTDGLQKVADARSTLATLCRALLHDRVVREGQHFTPAGSFWTNNATEPIELQERHPPDGPSSMVTLSLAGPFKSLAALSFELEEHDGGLLVLKSIREGFFSEESLELYESIAELLSRHIVHQRTQLALRERVKEATCLYGIARLVGRRDISLGGILQATVELFPPAWLYPELTSGRICLDDQTFLTPGYQKGCDWLVSQITVGGRVRGEVEVSYVEQQPELDEGPFLREERNLIDAVAKELALIVEQYEAGQERQELQQQLRHADRLATIGQLSAGVAHELNEPLGGILGYAQLAQKDPSISDQVHRDLSKIVAAALHAREVVQKLMLLARSTPPKEDWVNLNLLIEEGLYFIESRCAKAGIEVTKEQDKELPEIMGDPGQLYQVLVNLTVNAIQAMGAGGRLTIRTTRCESGIAIDIEDTGVGMSEEVQDQIFVPFFTTKDIGEGTGLGLAVVDGIVSSHGGSISVQSEEGVGTTFRVRLPLRRPQTGAASQAQDAPR